MSVECVCVWVMRVCVCAVSVCVCMSVTVWAVTPGLVHPDDPAWWSVKGPAQTTAGWQSTLYYVLSRDLRKNRVSQSWYVPG